MFTLEYAKNPIYASVDGQHINLTVKFEEMAEELPFTASASDCENHGRDLFARAAAGEFGPIAPYVAPQAQPQAVVQGAQTL